MAVQWKFQGTKCFKRVTKFWTWGYESTAVLARKKVQHKSVIVPSDLAKITASPFLSVTNPARLLRRMWFYVSLYWCRRGREGQQDLCRDSFKFTKDANGREYAVMTHEESTKNHPGGETSKPSAERDTRLYSTGADDDAFASLKLYVSKLNPSCPAFFQRFQIHHRRHRVIWKQPTWREQAARHDEDIYLTFPALHQLHH